jgi:ppGpp synthetase/RelA/SpoT-type nucleotidyltranferase
MELEGEPPVMGGEENPIESEATKRMLEELEQHAGQSFSADATAYRSLMTTVDSTIKESDFYIRLAQLHQELSEEFVLKKIRAIDAWASGDTSFKLVQKSWASMIDKLYRINIEDNNLRSAPPIVPTIVERAHRKDQGVRQRWITPLIAHEVVDDLFRTKFVVPFVDGVADVGARLDSIINGCGLRRFRRYHAKDSGYHAQHYYVILEAFDSSAKQIDVAIEIKILTKMQDNLGELTHLLYEKQRTKAVPTEKKRKSAWEPNTPQFQATYLGHSGHFIESAMLNLKAEILRLETE